MLSKYNEKSGRGTPPFVILKDKQVFVEAIKV